MSISLNAKLVETATKVTITYNEFGDKVYGSTSSVNCLYRDISTLTQIQNRNEISLDGYLWFSATEDVNKGDIYNHSDEGYLEIVRVIKAKRLVADNSLQFIKCEVAKQRQIS